MKAESIVKRAVRTACICLLICLGSALCVQAATQESETLKTAKEEGLTGLVLIKEKLYVLDENSEPATGTKVHTVKVGEEYYLVNKKGVVAPKGWNQVGKKKYYVRNKKGKLIAGGVQKVKKKYYYFTKKGKLSVKKKDRIVNVDGVDYYVTKTGQMGKGWQTIGKKHYYAKKNGELLKNTKKNGIKINAKGVAKKRPSPPKSALDKKADAIVASITKSSMSKGQKLAACWAFMTSSRNFRYSTAYYPKAYTQSEFRRLALIMLNGRAGNCYCFACGFAALAKSVGYSAYVVYGRCPGSRDGAADGYTRHCWVYIAGGYYDPEAQYAGFARGIYGQAYNPWREQGRCLI